MKKIYLFLFAIVLASCTDDSTKDVSKVTNYPNFEMLGDEVMFIHKGDTFTDPGVVVTEGGTEIDYTVSVRGQYQGGTSVDTNVDDVYYVTYNAVNQDGFTGSVTRTVIVAEVGDLVNSIAGVYTSTVVRNGTASAQYTDMKYILIWQVDDNTYMLSDGIGGYYAIGRAYGDAYLAGPIPITANNIAADDFTIPDFTVGTFGGNVEMLSFVANENDNSIDFTSSWDAGYNFEVHLDQIQF